MLARIIYERRLGGTALGSLTMAAAAIADAAAWIILAVVVSSFDGEVRIAVTAVVGAMVYTGLVFTAGRRLLNWLGAVGDRSGEAPAWVFTAVMGLLASGAWFTDRVGIHAVFGAFILGAAYPKGDHCQRLQDRIAPLTTAVLLPLFFVYSGLHTQLGLLNTSALWLVALAVFAVACLTKGGACAAAAHLAGARWPESTAVGALMNMRGVTELILLDIGLQRGLITPTFFTIFVLMAIGTTCLAGPVLDWGRRHWPERPAGSFNGD